MSATALHHSSMAIAWSAAADASRLAESIPPDMRAWFEAVYAGMGDDHRIETRCFARRKTNQRSFARTMRGAALYTAKHSEAYNTYTGMALRGLGAGGGKDNCTATRIVWAELDVKHFDNDVAATLRRLDRFGLSLPIVVFTGGGFHVQVPLSELIDLRLPGMKDRVEAVNRHLAHALGGDVSPDGIWDLARILRPPCTWNHKYDPPRPVELVRLDPDRRYALEELESLLRQHYPLPQPQPARRPERPEPEHGHGHGSAATLHQGRAADSGCGWLERPGDAYNTRTTWATLLEPLGWTALFTRDGVTFWRRPGKDHGHSATTNHGGADCLHVFTSSARPLEANRSYTKFGLYAALAPPLPRTRAEVEEVGREPPLLPIDDWEVPAMGAAVARVTHACPVRRQASATFGRAGMGTRISRTPSLWSALICSSFAPAGSGRRR